VWELLWTGAARAERVGDRVGGKSSRRGRRGGGVGRSVNGTGRNGTEGVDAVRQLAPPDYMGLHVVERLVVWAGLTVFSGPLLLAGLIPVD